MTARRALQEVIFRDAEGRKQCKRCETWLAERSFNEHPYSTDRLNPLCRNCCNSYNRVWKLKANYNMTLADYDRILAEQSGVCAICQMTESRKGAYNLTIDHDHACCPGIRSCGECVRGLLCSDCNHAIGLFRDDTERLRRASLYLERTP